MSLIRRPAAPQVWWNSCKSTASSSSSFLKIRDASSTKTWVAALSSTVLGSLTGSAYGTISGSLIGSAGTIPASRYHGVHQVRPISGSGARYHGIHAAKNDTQDPTHQPVLVKRLPEDYMQKTLLPHLESQMLYNVESYTSIELSRIARAYTQLPNRQRILCQRLSEQIKFRMIEFDGMHLVDALNAMWLLLPDDEELFEMIGERVVDILDEFNALNLIGIIRIYNKIQHYEIMNVLTPRLTALLQDYDTSELSEMLVALAHAGSAVQDMDVLVCLVPEIMRRFDELPLQVKITNLWAVTKLRIVHEDMLGNVTRDLCNKNLTKGMPPQQLCRVLWIYARCSCLDMVLPSLRNQLEANIDNFTCTDFARLSQALPVEGKESIAGYLPEGETKESMERTKESTEQIEAGDSAKEMYEDANGMKHWRADPSATLSNFSDLSVEGTPEAGAIVEEGKLRFHARANMSTTEAYRMLKTISDNIFAHGIPNLGRRDVILYLLGVTRCGFLDPTDLPDLEEEREKGPGLRRSDMLYEIFAYFLEEQDHFEKDELERIVTTLWFTKDYRHLIDILPKSWTDQIDEVLVRLESMEAEEGEEAE